METFLHTTHRTISWFKKASDREELVIAAPFQRNPVWTRAQKAYLIDTILRSLPVPELYMQESIDDEGNEQHTIVDGQQRIRACLDFIAGKVALSPDDSPEWANMKFDELLPEQREKFFGYKFVVRVLPKMSERDLRGIFTRLNRSVVALNQQELRHATYWGSFIKTIEKLADEDPFWANSGIFTTNDLRRMLDCEFISELAIAFLHGPQNKKDKLDEYYELYESEFEDEHRLDEIFRKTTAEISQILPSLKATRWSKKSDFYSLFLVLAKRAKHFPLAKEDRAQLAVQLLELANSIDALVRLDGDIPPEADKRQRDYARAVARAASDKANRIVRENALEGLLFEQEASEAPAIPG